MRRNRSDTQSCFLGGLNQFQPQSERSLAILSNRWHDKPSIPNSKEFVPFFNERDNIGNLNNQHNDSQIGDTNINDPNHKNRQRMMEIFKNQKTSTYLFDKKMNTEDISQPICTNPCSSIAGRLNQEAITQNQVDMALNGSLNFNKDGSKFREIYKWTKGSDFQDDQNYNKMMNKVNNSSFSIVTNKDKKEEFCVKSPVKSRKKNQNYGDFPESFITDIQYHNSQPDFTILNKKQQKNDVQASVTAKMHKDRIKNEDNLPKIRNISMRFQVFIFD